MIPCVINNFNRLSTTKKLVEDLQALNYTKIVILDNGSSYPPLLQWYNTLSDVVVYKLNNIGPRAIYDSGIIKSFPSWVAYTDSDIELNLNTPHGFIETMIEKAEKWGYTKAGLALRTDDIQPHQFGYNWREWESKYWTQELEKDVYHADVDTTFCIVRKDIPFQYRSIRLAGDFTCKHLPWYNSFDNLSEEEEYFLEHSSDDSTYKRCWKQYVASKSL